MAHGTEQHLEHAEHAQHHAHDPFDRRVAMSMAILAACLAMVAMQSHRGHTETLRLETLSSISHTQMSDKWNEYQAMNIRSHAYQTDLEMIDFLATKEGSESERDKARKRWQEQVKKYGTDESKGRLATIMSDAKAKEAKAKEEHDQSMHVHHAIDWVDFGHLGLDLALVLCSVSVLTKSRSFWLGGIAAGIVGLSLALFGTYQLYTPSHHGAEHDAPHGAMEAPRGGTSEGHP